MPLNNEMVPVELLVKLIEAIGVPVSGVSV